MSNLVKTYNHLIEDGYGPWMFVIACWLIGLPVLIADSYGFWGWSF